MIAVLETIVINDNNPNRIMDLLAILALIIIAREFVLIFLSRKRLEKLKHAKKLILERHEKIEEENRRRRKLNKGL